MRNRSFWSLVVYFLGVAALYTLFSSNILQVVDIAHSVEHGSITILPDENIPQAVDSSDQPVTADEKEKSATSSNSDKLLQSYLTMMGQVDLRIANVILFVGIVVGLVPILIAVFDNRNTKQMQEMRIELDTARRELQNDLRGIRDAAIQEVSSLAKVHALEALDSEFRASIKDRSDKLMADLVVKQNELQPVLLSFVNNEVPNSTKNGEFPLSYFVTFEWLLLAVVGGTPKTRKSALDRIISEYLPRLGFSTSAEFSALLTSIGQSSGPWGRDWTNLVDKAKAIVEQNLRSKMA